MTLYDEIQESADVLRRRLDNGGIELIPEVAIVLGTGLGGMAGVIDHAADIEYASIPGFAVPTVESHGGRLIFGTLRGRRVIAMQGRFHYYEGYSMREITFPVRVMHAMGARQLVVSNACGGLNPLYRRGDLMLIEDHINLLGDNPLIGPNDERLGPRFPDMSEPYSHGMIARAERAALRLGIPLRKGTYAAVPGPNLETRAEYRFLRTIGADVVGMSTIPEVIVARHLSMEVLGISIVTDECFPDALKPVDVAKIIAAANDAEPGMTAVVSETLAQD